MHIVFPVVNAYVNVKYLIFISFLYSISLTTPFGLFFFLLVLCSFTAICRIKRVKDEKEINKGM